MTIHTGEHSNQCGRSDKYPLNINIWHDYKLIWRDYEVLILVDGIPVGYATKYYKMFSGLQPVCKFGSSWNQVDPAINYSCEQLLLAPDNLLPTIPYIDFGPRPWWLPSAISWPPPQPPQPYLANKVDEHAYFPRKNDVMSLIINNDITADYKNDDFSVFSQSSMNLEIDWIKVYQPFCCGVNKTVCTLNDLDNQTYGTDILTGSVLNVGCSSSSDKFLQFKPGTGGNYRDTPIFLNATDEIAIQGDAIFEGETYTEMRITNCGSWFRTISEESKELKNFYEKQQQVEDSINNIYSTILDSITKDYSRNYIDSVKKEYSIIENQDFSIYPSPATEYFIIDSKPWYFDKIISLSLVDINGKMIELKIERKINIEKLQSGTYILKILLNDGLIINKSIIKI